MQHVDEDQYISVRGGPRLNRLARRPELEALFSKASLISDLHLDIIDALKTAREAEIITPDCERDFRCRFLDQRETMVNINMKLFLWIVSKAQDGICGVLILLKLIGHGSVAIEIENALYEGRISEIGSATIHNTKAVEIFYYNWKRYIDNNVFQDRLAALRWMSGELKTKMSRGENYSKRQLLANKFAILHILFIPNLRDLAEREATIQTMKESVPSDLDHVAVDLVRTKCMAWSLQIDGNIERTFRTLHQFETMVAQLNIPFLKCLFYLLSCETCRMFALANPNNGEYRRRCIFYGEKGLQICQDLEEDVCLQQRRMFVVSIVYLLLGIHADLRVIRTPPDTKSRMLAKMYLKDLKTTLFKGIESRREVQYYLCMARLNETDDLEMAIAYASQALKLSEDSSIFPSSIGNIAEYEQRLKDLLPG